MTDRDPAHIDLAGAERRPLRVCSYVEQPFDTVVDELGRAAVGALFAAAVLDALGRDDAVHEHDVELVARGVARIRLSWSVPGTPAASTATVSVLAVRTGRDPLTELLLDVPVEPATARQHADAARRFLAELDRALGQLTATAG